MKKIEKPKLRGDLRNNSLEFFKGMKVEKDNERRWNCHRVDKVETKTIKCNVGSWIGF